MSTGMMPGAALPFCGLRFRSRGRHSKRWAAPCPTFNELSAAHRHPLSAEQIYSERHMFHGPCFQGLAGEIIIGDQGIAGEFVVRSPEALFRSTRYPQLLADPALLDAVGQLIGIFAAEHGRTA